MTATLGEKATATIVDVLRLRAETQKDQIAYRFLADGEDERGSLTYGELYRRACQVAAELQRKSAVGERALLLDSSVSDYIVTFFGCLCAGVIAVPIYAPRVNKKGNARVESVVADAQPSVVLTAGAGSSAVRDLVMASAGEQVHWIDTEALTVSGDELGTLPAVSHTDIAFLQYTSGSTAAPKGVMVSHANILHNERMIQNAFDTKPGDVIVGWLPLFHDMGLIGNVLQPLFAGVPCILMSPVAFLQRPLRWLQAISRYRATTSGGPNFAYELCMRKIRPEDRSGLDLSSWRVAFNGAEPVRLETMHRFAAQFADCGFRREAFVPCYGLAEATLFVSGGLDPKGVATVNYGVDGSTSNGGSGNGAKTPRKQGKLLVACGRPPEEQTVRIVSPDSQQQCSPGDVGEIWISGPSVAQGYWRKAKETEETFNARIPGFDNGPFLRTGDLGFLKDGHLFITGRLKDLLIIRGQNYYPQDIELTVEQSHPVLQPGSGAAFSVEIEGEERLVVVQEVAVLKDPESIVQKDLDELDALIKLISRNIVAGHELQAFAIVLVRKGTIPKTSSGKIQRHASRNAFLSRELYVLREWHERKRVEPVLPQPSNRESDGHVPDALASWLAQEIARIQGIEQERVDLNQPFSAYGLDSLAAIEFAHKLQTDFKIDVDVAEFFGDSTITEIIGRATGALGESVNKRGSEQPARYPLSYGQRALWFVHQTAPESAAYNIARVIRIAAVLDVGAMRLALQALVDRHACLRATVVETEGEPLQQVAEKVEVSFEYVDARHWSEVDLEKSLIQQSQRPFSLTSGPLFRTRLYARPEKEHLLHVTVHHLVADYWSLTLLLDEIGKLYQASVNKVEPHLVPLEYSYADFVEWQREKLSGPAGEKLRDYWKKELAGELPPLSLPVDHSRPPVQTFRGASLPFNLDARLTKALKRLAEEQQATLFTTLLAAFQVLLYRLSSQKQVIVGCPISGRSRAEFAHTAGYFVNAVPLRADFQHRQTFTEFLSQVRNRVSKAFAHELYPFSLMVEQLGMARDPAVPPIFQSAFVFQQTYGSRSQEFVRFALGQPQAQVTLGGLRLEHVPVEQRTAQFDLTLTVGEGPDGILGAWEYSSDLFEEATIARWAESFSILLEEIISHPGISVSQLRLLSDRQYGELVEELNRTKLEYDSDRCLHELIEEQAKAGLASAAIVRGETELSYAELNERANQVARYLIRAGVQKEDLVGVCMRRSLDMVVAMLGIWKANAAYVPLDPQYPEERLRFMLEDADAKAVITEESLKARVEGTSATVLSWGGVREQIERESSENLGRPACSLQLAYLIYTSGSSGIPKGVMLTHRNAVSFVAWAKQAFTQEEFSGVLAATSICFDLSIFELWATLSSGGTVVLADDVIGWWESLQGGRVTNCARLLNTVPSAVAQVIAQGPLPEGVVTINLAGEALKEELVSGLYQSGSLKRVNNLYGPTETTTYSSWTTVETGKKVTIGRGVGNTQLYVLDHELELAPLGVVGELYIAGAGVGRGYWGRPGLTAERFLPDPYSKTAGDRMYRTGDLVRWNNAGQMEYLGRADQQVKVRGFRIELGEIEASISWFPAVRENVVVVRDSVSDRALVAYIAPRDGMQINEEQLREYLRKRLPRYMLPSTFIILESLPKTPNGKVDRKALPAPRQREVKGRKPQNEIEEMVAAIWAQVMQLDRVGVEENFFSLGGHSILAMQVTSRIRQVFAVELQLRSFVENPTVAALALLVDKADKTAIPPLLPRPRRQSLRLSFAQERLWFLSRYEVETSLYNVPVAMRLRGALNIQAAKASLQEMVNRHEALRTSFPEVGDGAIQDIAAEMEVPFVAAEIREDELHGALREQARRPFDLSHGPLIRASLFHISTQDHVLLVVMHHIVSDGWSLGVMLREFNSLYNSFSRGAASSLPALPIQYADYSEWQREWLQGEVLERQLGYWRKQLAGHETLNFPTDRAHSAKPTLAGAIETSCLPEPLVGQLKLFSAQQGVTLFITLLAGFKILLYRYTGQTDISVGSGIANRNRQELEPLIGFFVNTLVLRTQFTEDFSVAQLLHRVRDVSLQAYAHQDIPFERLVEALNPVRELNRTPFFQALFALQNAPLPSVSWDGLEATASIVETGTAKFDLTLSAHEEDGELKLSLEYRTELFNPQRMKRLLQHYRTLLEEVVVSLDARISELEILSEPERQQLLVAWKRPETPYSADKCLHQFFEEQAAKTPTAIAVRDGDRQIRFAELNRRANQLAHYLAKLGISPEVRVGICMERGLEMLVSVLGVLKAGGVYVPLDPADPSERRNSMARDAGAKCVLTDQRFTQQIAGYTEHVVDLEQAREEIEKQSSDDLKVPLDAANLAWVIYTSSSAGRPEGTAIPHCSAVSMQQQALIDATDQYPSVERLLSLYAPNGDIAYAMCAEEKPDEQGAIKTGISRNTQAYVLDGHMKLVPVGINGELYIGASGQARGYLNRPELTAENFVPNPFSQAGGERLYRTGELVGYRENGSLEFLGRLDSQLKLHGHRIEPGEIEAAVLDYPGVTQAAVITREDEPGDVRLVGYVASSEKLDLDGLRKHLQQRVPEYMVPAALLQLDTLPLTTHGKVDRKALSELESQKALEAGALTLTPTEELIAGVWSSLLEKPDIRRDDNFFDLGGHSLTVIQMLSRLELVFKRDIELRAMFEFPVLKDFSAYVDQLTGSAQLATLRPIVSTLRDGDLPLSVQQEQLWFLEQIAAGSAIYSLPGAVRLRGDLDKLALRLSLNEIVRRHEILRTSFLQVDAKPKQRIHQAVEFELVERDLREATTGVATQDSINRERKEEATSPFLLSEPRLFRAKLLQVAEQEHILLLTFHHIVFDGWSIGVMINELGQLYKAFHEGLSSPLPELPVQYADYTVWQREVMADGELVDGLEYWKKQLAGLSELDLPSDHPRPAVQSFRGTVERWKMSPEDSAAIRKIAQEQGLTLFMTLLAGFQILLARYSGQRDIAVGSPVANRTQPELEALIGFFVNTLVLRGKISGGMTVEKVLQNAREVCLGAYAHQGVPFEHLADELQLERDSSRPPLFQVMFALQNAPASALQMHGLEVSMLSSAASGVRFDPSPTSGARFDLTLVVEDHPEHLQGMMEYSTDLYERTTVRRMLDHYQHVLREIARDPGQLVSTIPLLSPAERQQLLAEGNQHNAKSQHKCLHELFEQQANRTPNAPAVAHHGVALTYTELNQRANQLGRYLRALGVGPGQLVGILLPRCSELLVAMLGVLKAGAAYVFLDTNNQVRSGHILREVKPHVVIGQQDVSPELPAYVGKRIYLETEWNKISREKSQNLGALVHSENLAYVTYEFEDHEAPEGVVVQHGTLASLVRWAQSALSAGDLQRVPTLNPPTSVLSILDTYVPLCCGGTIVVVDELFGGINLEETDTTLMNVTPSVLRELLRRKAVPPSVRTIILAGEPVSSGLVRRTYDNGAIQRVINLYGSSELSLGSTIAELRPGTDDKKVSIGRPVENAQAFVLDAHMELVPAGVVGELYLSAATSPQGYFNRPDLTAERLVPNIFGSQGERLFRTGELARHKANGELELWGRVDHETRIRGHRVDMEEIEHALERQPEVADAVVLVPQTGVAQNNLVAYIIPQTNAATDDDALELTLRVALQKTLPEYMVPSYWATMERLPLLPDGKLDRSALPAVQPKMEEASGPALTPTEELIAGVWSTLLGKSTIRPDDNFFHLGGHSLTVIQMLSRLERVLNRELELRAMFEFPVLKDFSAYVDQLTGVAQLARLAIVPTSRDRHIPLSFAQQRLWFLAQMEGASAAYHIPFGLHLKGGLNRTALRRMLDRILVRHEVLRTTFAFRDGEPVQVIGAVEESSFRLVEHDLCGHNDVQVELAALSKLEAGASFDLAAGPLIRGRLIRLAQNEHVLLVTMHHIVSDGWSMGVLVSELKALYGAFLRGEADPLPELEIQYADYAVWQRQWIEGEILQEQAAYWKTTLAGAPALLELPTDHARPVQQNFAGGFVKLVLDEQLTAGLKDLSRRHGTTLYMTLLAGWAVLLARLSGQQDVVIGSPVANRRRAEIENLIGFFVNTLVLRLDLSGSPSVSQLLQQTKTQSLAAQRHQDIPFEQVVELAQPVRSLAHSSLFQVMFAWQNAVESSLELPGLELEPFEPSPHRVAKFDMTLSLQAAGDTIAGVVEYASALFEAATVHRYIGYFLALLKAMVAGDAQSIDRLPMLSVGEREQVLYKWNETKAEFPRGQCVQELFEEQVRRSPQAMAVAFAEEDLSYGELNARANQLAHSLKESGFGPETRIALMVERSIEMVVGLLGVLKAGAAYVPLDPGSTRERLKYMLEDSGARLVLTSRSLSPKIRDVAGPEVLLMEAEEWRRSSSENPRVTIEPAQLAYVIYTSGSTGRPKGVGVEHRQLFNYVSAIGEKLQIEAGARLALVSTYAADLGYTMIFPALCYGGCLDVVDAGRVLDASKLQEHFSRHPADYLKIVPSHLRALLDSSEGSGLLPRRWLILGGEASSWDLIHRVKQRGAGCQVLNHYGPTETTVGVLTYDTTQNDAGPQLGGMVPIGRPLSNAKVYVLDSEFNPVGVGVSGEIYIGGAGVARGYLERAELTAEKFLPNPYSLETGGRMYRTGDLGRFLKNGNVEFLGRTDHQVKIRGFRVELGEIEAALVEHPKVRQALVVAREDEPGSKRLVAYVVPGQEAGEGDSGNQEAGLRISELREHMLGKLPEYMVPSAYIKLEKLPLTHNGKIDRKNLPQSDPDMPEQEQEYVGPQDATQETLCRLWQLVLRRQRVGIHDNFFTIGGHSLLAVQVISRIKSAFAIEMPLSLIFVAPTVARMAKEIAALQGHEQPQPSPVLVSIQPQGSRVPFFCVHPVGGQVISYAELSQEMGLDQPFYGLQSPPANYFRDPGVSIEQLATLYNQEIRRVQPVGPYLLSGWSMGGLVAWEMAQQLTKEGQIVSLLALIDTVPPPRYREADDRAGDISVLARFALDMSRLAGRDPRPLKEQFLQASEQDQWKLVQETLTSYGVLAPQTADAEMAGLLDVYTRNFRAMNNYSILTSKQAVIYFRASETPERFSALWTNWAGGGIQYHSVPGDHFTMLRRPNVNIIAESLQRHVSMNDNNLCKAVNLETSPVFIGIEG